MACIAFKSYELGGVLCVRGVPLGQCVKVSLGGARRVRMAADLAGSRTHPP